MITTEFGKINVKESVVDYSTRLEFISDSEEDSTYLVTLDQKNLEQMIHILTDINNRFKKQKERRKELMTTTNFTKIYSDMEQKHHPYPTQMARSDAFGHALADGIIDEETYLAAREYYGKLWNYVGD